MGANFAPARNRGMRSPCTGPSCRQSVPGRRRYCPFHWRQLPQETRAALTDAYQRGAWHIFVDLGKQADVLLREIERERIASAQASIARLIGESQ